MYPALTLRGEGNGGWYILHVPGHPEKLVYVTGSTFKDNWSWNATLSDTATPFSTYHLQKLYSLQLLMGDQYSDPMRGTWGRRKSMVATACMCATPMAPAQAC